MKTMRLLVSLVILLFVSLVILITLALSNPAEATQFNVVPAQTPLLAALPLFATGLAGLALLGWRRRKTAAG